MFQPPRSAAGGGAVVRAVLAAALVFSAFGATPSDAQQGPALRLRQLELTPMGRARGRHGRVTRWGLRYARSGRAAHPAQLEVTLVADRGRPMTRSIALDQRRGVVPIGPARGQARVQIRAFDRLGQPMALRVGRGPRLGALELWTPTRRDRRQRLHAERTHSSRRVTTRAAVRVTPHEADAHPAEPRRTEPRRARRDPRGGSPEQLALADRACRDAFVGNENEMRCLALVRFQAQPEARVAACESAFSGDDAELRCLESGATPRHVHACESLLTGDDAELECLDVVGASHARPAMVDEVLRICDERIGDDAELACVADLLGVRAAKP